MQSAERAVRQFDPELEMRLRWPQWRVMFVALSCGEVWVDSERLVLLPLPETEFDRARSLTHVCAHLALGHVGGECVITNKQETEADWMVGVWLDDGVAA